MTQETDSVVSSDPIQTAGSQWLASAMPDLQTHFEACGWDIGPAPDLSSIDSIDLYGLQLLVALRRRTQAKRGNCDFQQVPDIVTEAARSAGLQDWLAIDGEPSA